jgi:uncharacterized protein (TIGR02118 family)
MSLVHLLSIKGGHGDPRGLADWARKAPAAALLSLPGVMGLDLLVATENQARDPKRQTEDATPAVAFETAFADLEALHAAMRAPAFAGLVELIEVAPLGGAQAMHDVMNRVRFPVAGETAPTPIEAPIVYVVRYPRPAEDETHFIAYYFDHHPPIIGRFPRIRNFVGYLPVGWINYSALARANYLVGGDLVFDSVADLQTALASPVRPELSKDSENFPKYRGPNMHYTMHRTRLHPA